MDGNQNTVASGQFSIFNKSAGSTIFNATNPTSTPFSSNKAPSTLFGGANTSNSTPLIDCGGNLFSGSLSQSSYKSSLFGMNTATHNTTSSASTPFSGSSTSSSSFGGSGSNSLFKSNSNASTATGWNNASNAGGSMNVGVFTTPATSMNTNPNIFGNSNTSMITSSVSQRVHEIYNQYNPSKISEIPTILEKYKGKEQELISKLEQKYGIASSAMGSNNSSAFGGSFGKGIGNNNNNNKPAGVSTFGSFSSFGQPQQQQQQQQQQQASSSLFGSSGQVGMGGARFGATSALGNNQQNRSSLFVSR